jgi:sporulation protein YlmC with PRC-barrel domain
MNKLSALVTALLAVVLLAGPSSAGDTMKGEKYSGTMENRGNMMEGRDYTADQLRGLAVYDLKGEYIGNIEDVNLNAETGKINYVILAKGSLLGLGEDKHAVPLAALNIEVDKDRATLLVAEDKLETAPTKAAGMSDDKFLGLIQEHYGIAPAFEKDMGGSERMMKEQKKVHRENRGYY